jgi:hypothetical protein
MALPSTGYDTATVTNPGSALTDFTLMVDLSKASASWWAVVDTADGTKGRAAKSDGTELATDWIAFDNSAKTGWLRVKWTGTLAASGSQVLRIYPPNTANSSNAANATYGSDNAYDVSWKGYWPLHDQYDRTSNSNDLTAAGGVSIGGSSSGPFGASTDFDGTDDYAYNSSGPTIANSGTRPVTIILWCQWHETDTGGSAFSIGNGDAMNRCQAHLGYAGSAYWDYPGQNTTDRATYNAVKNTGDWVHFALTGDTTAGLEIFEGSVSKATDASVSAPSADKVGVWIGAWPTGGSGGNYHDGAIAGFQVHGAVRSADWIAEEYAQTNANATFWGTWTWNASIAVLLDEEDD